MPQTTRPNCHYMEDTKTNRHLVKNIKRESDILSGVNLGRWATMLSISMCNASTRSKKECV